LIQINGSHEFYQMGIAATFTGFGFAALQMSAFGPKRTSVIATHMSAFGGKTDMAFCSANVG
jgi:hypothetical protein